MSAGCLVIGSDTPPVREVISSGENGLLVPFFAVDELAERVIEALQEPERFNAIRDAARSFVVDHYDAEQICVPTNAAASSISRQPRQSPRSVWPGRPASEWSKATRRASRKSSAVSRNGDVRREEAGLP